MSYRNQDVAPADPVQDAPTTVVDLVGRAIARGEDTPYLYFEDRVYTYRDLEIERSRVTSALSTMDLPAGSRLATLIPNSPEFLFTWFGAMGLGSPLVPINPKLTAREIEEVVRLSESSVVVVDHETSGVAHGALADLVPDVAIVDVGELLTQPPAVGLQAQVAPGDPVVFLATSGTSGPPKLVVQTHRSYAMAGESFPAWLGLEARDRLMAVLPLFHLNAQAYSTLGSLAAGASLVLTRRFSARDFWAQTHAYGVTQFNSIGAILRILLRQEPTETKPTIRCGCATRHQPLRRPSSICASKTGLG